MLDYDNCQNSYERNNHKPPPHTPLLRNVNLIDVGYFFRFGSQIALSLHENQLTVCSITIKHEFFPERERELTGPPQYLAPKLNAAVLIGPAAALGED
jgi:hypothetical protein